MMKLLTVNVEKILAVDNETNTVTPGGAHLTMQEINNKYGDLFEGYRKLEGKLHLEADPSVPPVRMPLRRLPLPIKEKVKADLDAMEVSGIIANDLYVFLHS